jgi:hypothetical protein
MPTCSRKASPVPRQVNRGLEHRASSLRTRLKQVLYVGKPPSVHNNREKFSDCHNCNSYPELAVRRLRLWNRVVNSATARHERTYHHLGVGCNACFSGRPTAFSASCCKETNCNQAQIPPAVSPTTQAWVCGSQAIYHRTWSFSSRSHVNGALSSTCQTRATRLPLTRRIRPRISRTCTVERTR